MKILLRILIILISTLTVLLFASHLILPDIVDKEYNGIHSNPQHSNVLGQVKDQHRQLNIADLHCDALIWGRDLLARGKHGHVDIPRLVEGNVALQVLCVPTKVPKGVSQWGTDPNSLDLITLSAVVQVWRIQSWFNLPDRVFYLSELLHETERKSGGQFKIIKYSPELSEFLSKRERDINLTSGILAIEGLHALDGEIANLDRFYQSGYRIMGLVHQFDNDLGGSCSGLEGGGLTEFGKKVIKKMDEMGIIIDLAHASEKLIDDVLQCTSRPVIVSHTGVRGTCNRNRNLRDKHIMEIAKRGGIIGIGFWNGAVCGYDAQAIANAIKYTSKRIGVDHVALGSDFDGSTATPFDATGMILVTNALFEVGFTFSDIEKIMGGNVLGFLEKQLPRK